MKYKIRVTLESKEDVIRELEINSDCILSELHYFIIDSLALDKKELASFYTVNDDLELVNEFPLISFEENSSNMENTKLESILKEENDKLIYVFDYMKMWRFLIDLIKIESDFLVFVAKPASAPVNSSCLKNESVCRESLNSL